MWFPVPLLLPLPQTSPYAPQLSGMSYGSGSFQLQMIPFDRHSFQNGFLSIDDGRQFLLNRSLFDLVKVTNILELTDAKLLGWYLALPVEDQKLIQESGGFMRFLQRHPALEVTKQFVYVKRTDPAAESYRPLQTMSVNLNKSRRPTFYGVTECLNCGTSCPSGGQRCRRCTAPFQMGMDSGDQDTELQLGPKNLNDLLNCAEGSAVGSQKAHWGSTGSPCPLDPISKDNHLQTLHESFQSACDVSSQVLGEPPSHQEAPCSVVPTQHQPQLWEEGAKQDDPSAQANFSLDMELEMCSQKGAMGFQGGPCADAEYPTIADETPPEYSSFSSTRLDRTEWNNSSQSAEAEGDDSLLANRGSAEEPLDGVSVASSCPLEEKEHYLNKSCNCTYDVEDGPGDPVRREEGLRCRQENEEEEDFHSIMEEDKSILLCQTSERIHLVNSAHAPVSPSKAMVTSVAAFNFPRSPHKAIMTDGSTNTLPPVSTHDVCVGPNSSLAGCQQHIQTQTQGPSTADRSVNTEVYMADLDFLAKEFRKLKVAEEDLQELKGKMERSAGAGREGESSCGCNSAQRARRAELCLVALQYGMCQQHCWRRYYTSPEGDRLLQGVEVPPENLLEVLKVLEADYKEMREKILAGIPLDQLKPLAVDSQKITSATCYIPAQIIGETLERASSLVSERSSQQTAGGGDVRPPASTGSQTGERGRGPVCLPKVGSNKTGKAVILLPQPTGFHHGRKPGGGKELNSSEAWYDAEEDLWPAVATAKAKTQRAEADDGGAVQGQDTYHSSLLCVTQFPSDVTEGDLMLLFEKYQASEVSISTFRNNLKAAIVTISGSNFAEAAVGEMSGHIIQGHRLHVEHIQRPNPGGSDENQSLGTTTQPQSSSTTLSPQPSGDNQRPQSSSESHCTTTYVKPFRPFLEKRTVVCDSPTASGTCVPQHYATMGSFDTLMSRLTAQHPEAGRQRIVDALLELRAKHQGYLSGLPLSMIVDMTSDLLTKSKIMKG